MAGLNKKKIHLNSLSQQGVTIDNYLNRSPSCESILIALVVIMAGYLAPAVSQAFSIDTQLGFVKANGSRQSEVAILGDTPFAIIMSEHPTSSIKVQEFDVKTGFKGTKQT